MSDTLSHHPHKVQSNKGGEKAAASMQESLKRMSGQDAVEEEKDERG